MNEASSSTAATGQWQRFQSNCEFAAKCSIVGQFAAFPISLALSNILLALTLVFALFAGRYRQRWESVRHHPVVWFALGLYFWIVLACTYTVAPFSDITLHLGKYAKLLFAVVFISLLPQEQWRERCWRAFALAMIFIVLCVYINVWFDLPWSATHNQGWGADHHVFGDSITQNIMMAFFVLFAMIRSRSSKDWSKKIFWGAFALAAAVTIAQLSQGRTGYVLLALICAAFFWVVVSTRFGLPIRIILMGAVTLTMISLVQYSPLMMQRFERAISEAKAADSDRTSSIGHRLYNYRRSIELIVKNPIIGTGTGSYHTVSCSTLDVGERCSHYNWHPHNQFLLFGVDQGLIGVMLYVALFAAIAQYAARQTPEYRIASYGLVMIWVVDSMLNSPLFSARENQFFLYMMALLMAQPLTSITTTQQHA